jgi:hypothetical protein
MNFNFTKKNLVLFFANKKNERTKIDSEKKRSFFIILIQNLFEKKKKILHQFLFFLSL